MFDLLGVFRDEGAEVVHVHTLLGMFLQLKTFVLIFREKITDAFLQSNCSYSLSDV